MWSKEGARPNEYVITIIHRLAPFKADFFYADCRDRTCDLRVTSALLYQLS